MKRVLDLISAMMSILGLQTAMIARFSENGARFRMVMNAVTGGCVYGAVIVIAGYILSLLTSIKAEGIIGCNKNTNSCCSFLISYCSIVFEREGKKHDRLC